MWSATAMSTPSTLTDDGSCEQLRRCHVPQIMASDFLDLHHLIVYEPELQHLGAFCDNAGV
jgi:hypothetical protein